MATATRPPARREHGQVALEDARAVGDEDVGVEDPGPLQDLDRRDAVAGEACLGLVAVLRGVDVDRQAVLAGELGGGGEVGVLDGIGRVRGERGGDPPAGGTAMVEREPQRLLAAVWTLRGEEGLAELGPDPGLGHDGGDHVHREVVVGEGRDAAAEHLGAREPGAQLDVLLGEVRLDRPDVVVEPLVGRHVLGDPAQRDHRRVGVAVDQPGKGHLPAGVDALPSPAVCRPGGDRLDDAVADDDGRVIQELDRLGLAVHERGAARDDEIGRNVAHSTTVGQLQVDG